MRIAKYNDLSGVAPSPAPVPRGGMSLAAAKNAAGTAALLGELPHVPVGLPHVEKALLQGVLFNEVFVQ